MDFRYLKSFLTVAETGNVTKAAELLNIVQPAVSRQIRLLEEDLGIRLFERSRHGMLLTDAGKSLVDYSRRIMLEVERARLELAGPTTEVTGLVTVGLLPSTSLILSNALVSAVSSRYPGIRLRIVMGYAGTLLRWLETGEVDIALLYESERSTDIQVEPLVEEPLWIIGPRDALLDKRRPMSVSQLASTKLILPSSLHGIRILVEHACAAAGVKLDVSVETNALSVQRSLVLGGHGLTILPPIAVADDLASGVLSGAPLESPAITRRIVLGVPTNRPIGRHCKSVHEILYNEMKNTMDNGLWLEGRWLG